MKTAKTRKSSAAQRGRIMRVCYCTSLKFLREKNQSRNETPTPKCKKEELRRKNRPDQTCPLRQSHETMMENVYAQAVPKILDRSNPENPCAREYVESKEAGV